MDIDVPVKFEGVVTVNTPDHLSEEDATRLAKKWAIAKIVAVTENDDGPEEECYDEYTDECSDGAKETSDNDWEECTGGVGGEWELPK